MEQEPDRLPRFISWLQANGVQLQVSTIKHSKRKASGLGVFTLCDNLEGVLMVTPLHLAITPMSVLQDPEFGKAYAKLFEDGDVDDRMLMILFLMVERIRGSSSLWAPYLDVLPTSFGTPLWFTEEELQELKGTTLYNATKIQLKNLKALFADKVKPFAEQILSSSGALEREIDFEEFLWANCIFWTRALNIPCPHSFVFPKQAPVGNTDVNLEIQHDHERHSKFGVSEQPMDPSRIANKDSKFDISEEGCGLQNEKDAENLIYTDDSMDAKQNSDLSKETPPESVWVEGLVPGIDFCNHAPRGIANWEVDGDDGSATGVPNSMYLKTDLHLSADEEILISYGNKGNEELLFLYGFVIENNPDDYLMVHFPKEALDQDPCGKVKVQLLQEQLSQSGLQTAPTGEDVRAAVWEVCGNTSALQLLTDLIAARLLDLEEGTGNEEMDQDILNSVCQESHYALSENIKSCITYRKGQKYLAKQFFKESEHLLELCISEEDIRDQHGKARETLSRKS